MFSLIAYVFWLYYVDAMHVTGIRSNTQQFIANSSKSHTRTRARARAHKRTHKRTRTQLMEVADYIKYLQSPICTHRTDPTVYSYIIKHVITSAFGVFVNTFQLPDRIPWVSISRCEKMRPKQETSCNANSKEAHFTCSKLVKF